MGMKVKAADFLYIYDGNRVRIKINAVETTAMIEFFVNDALVYYKPVDNFETKYNLDVEMITDIVLHMEEDSDRWRTEFKPDCKWLIENYKNLVSMERKSQYMFTFPDVKEVFNMFIVEKFDGSVRLEIQNKEDNNRMYIDINMDNGLDVVKEIEKYSNVLHQMVELLASAQSNARESKFGKTQE